MSSCCSANYQEVLIFTCAGAAHRGQVADRAGVQLMEQGCGALFRIAAVAAEIPRKLDRARRAAKRMALDGCEDRCVLKTLQKAGLPADVHVVLTVWASRHTGGAQWLLMVARSWIRSKPNWNRVW